MHTPDENTNTADWKTECLQSIDELARRGAHRMIQAAPQAEVEDYLEHHRALRDQRGHAPGSPQWKVPGTDIHLGRGNAPSLSLW